MSEPKFTPGPWRLILSPSSFSYPSVQRGKSGGFCVQDFELDRAEADAALIAAAPDLYAALDGLLADITEYQTINKLGGENNHWQVIARDALAKARGEK